MKTGTAHHEGAKASKDSSRDNWRTPKWLMDVLHAEFPMLWDATAHGPDEWAHGCVFGNRETDALSSTWAVDVPVFCNPPFSQMKEWSKRIAAHPGTTVTVCKLAPSAKWWKTLCLTGRSIDRCLAGKQDSPMGVIHKVHLFNPVTLWLLPCRVSYEPPPSINASAPSFDSCVVVRR